MTVRRLEKDDRFFEAEVNARTITTREGVIGTAGIEAKRSFQQERERMKESDALEQRMRAMEREGWTWLEAGARPPRKPQSTKLAAPQGGTVTVTTRSSDEDRSIADRLRFTMVSDAAGHGHRGAASSARSSGSSAGGQRRRPPRWSAPLTPLP